MYSKFAQDATASPQRVMRSGRPAHSAQLLGHAVLDVTYLPTAFLADEQGVIRSRVRRALTLEELEAAVQAQLK